MSKRHNCSSCLYWKWSTGEDIGRCSFEGVHFESIRGIAVKTLKGSVLTGCGAKCDFHERHPQYGNFEETP